MNTPVVAVIANMYTASCLLVLIVKYDTFQHGKQQQSLRNTTLVYIYYESVHVHNVLFSIFEVQHYYCRLPLYLKDLLNSLYFVVSSKLSVDTL